MAFGAPRPARARWWSHGFDTARLSLARRYMGDMVEWPPKTFYRCVEGCASGTATPPLKGYQATKTLGVEQAPVLQAEECAHDEL